MDVRRNDPPRLRSKGAGVTSHNDQIRALITEIDDLLGSSPGLLWGLSGDRARHRAALEHLRTYLSALQNSARKARIRNLPPAAGTGLEPGLEPGLQSSPESRAGTNQLSLKAQPPEVQSPEVQFPEVQSPEAINLAQGQFLDQLSQDLNQLRHSLLAPLQAEVEQLLTQRQALSQEVQQLQQQRVLASGASASGQDPLLRDFMESLMVRLQERLVVQVADLLQQSIAPLLANTSTAALPAAEQQQIEQLHSRANALLGNLDSTLQVFSKTLEQNVQGYQQSLTQGLERMHSLGQRGEVMVASLVDRLAEQMEARTALYLQAPYLQTSGSMPLPGTADPLRLVGQAGKPLLDGGAAIAGPASGGIVSDVSTQSDSAGIPRLDSTARTTVERSNSSTSSAGIARRRVMAAQASDRAQTALGDRELGISGLNWSNTSLSSGSRSASLEDFYASLEPPRSEAPWPLSAAAATAERPGQAVRSLGAGGAPGTMTGAAPGTRLGDRYQKLEDALFDGIPEGEFPRALHRSQVELLSESLPALADRRFDDFAAFGSPSPETSSGPGEGSDSLAAALYGDPSYWRNAAPVASPAKKNAFLRRIRSARTA